MCTRVCVCKYVCVCVCFGWWKGRESRGQLQTEERLLQPHQQGWRVETSVWERAAMSAAVRTCVYVCVGVGVCVCVSVGLSLRGPPHS